jgi:hypothetical protein
MEFLGQMPTPPPVSPDQWISTFVEKCKHDDMISDTFGDEDAPYDAKAYFENTVNEIAENMGITVNSVLNIIHRAKYKFSRYMFIMHYMDKMPERKIINALNSGEYNKINYNDFF